MRLFNIILACSSVFLTSCYLDVAPDANAVFVPKVVIQSEIGPGNVPKAIISLSKPISGLSEDIVLTSENVDATISNVSLNDPHRMALSIEQNAFISNTIEIEEGETYSLTISLDEPGVNVSTAYAETTIPFSTKLENVIVSSIASAEGSAWRKFVSLTIPIPEPVEAGAYYHLVPEMLNPNLLPLEERYLSLDSKSVEIIDNKNAVFKYIHKNGIFIDYTKLQSDTIRLDLEIPLDIESIDLIDHLLLNFNTINAAAMDFHEQTDRTIRTSTLPIDEPLISETNVSNGLGYFGAFSTSTLKVEI